MLTSEETGLFRSEDITLIILRPSHNHITLKMRNKHDRENRASQMPLISKYFSP